MKNRLARQQTLFWTLLLVAATTIILFETGILPKDVWATYSTNSYITEVTAILLAIALIPLANKRFSSKMKNAKEADDETFLKTCRRELDIRLLLLFAVMLTNITLYYISGDDNMIYWALIGILAYIFGYPLNQYQHREKEQ